MLSFINKKSKKNSYKDSSEVEIVATTQDQIANLSVNGKHKLVIVYLSPDCSNPETIVQSIGNKFKEIPHRLVLMSSGFLGGEELYNQGASSNQVLMHFFPESLIDQIASFEIPVTGDSQAIEKSISSTVNVSTNPQHLKLRELER